MNGIGFAGFAEDENTDLSYSEYIGLGDVPICVGNVKRNHRHRPNTGLNLFLTTMAFLTLFLAIGIGIGHYIGN